MARTQLDEAERHRLAGRSSKAIEAYREVVRMAPELTSAHVALGALLDQEGKPREALRVFDQGLEGKPDHRDLLFNAAVVAQRLGELPQALSYVERALDTERQDAALFALRASILRRLDRLDEALAALQTAQALTPGDARLSFSLGNVYYQLGREEDAIQAYRQALKLDRSLLRAYYNLGAVLFEAERFDEALKEYETGLRPLDRAFARGERVPAHHARAYANVGAIYSRRGNDDGAVEAYGKALRLDPDQPTVYYNLGFIHFRAGRDEDAIGAYQRALELDPNLPLAYLHLGEIHHRRGQMKEAVRLLEAGLRHLEPESRERAHLLRGSAYADLGQPEASEGAYRASLAENPESIDALTGLAKLLRQQGRSSEAMPLLERAHGLETGNPTVALELAAVARSAGDLTREASVYRQLAAQRDGPELWPIQLNLVLIELRLERTAQARKLLAPLIDRLSGLAREDPARWSRLAEELTGVHALLLAQNGDLKTSARLLQGVLRSKPESRTALLSLAAIDALEGRSDNAINRLNAILKGTEPGPARDYVRGQLGLVLWNGTRSAKAAAPLASAAATFPEWLEVRTALGEAELMAGRHFEAVTHLSAVERLCRGSAPRAPRLERRWHLTLGDLGAQASLCRAGRSTLATALALGAAAELAVNRQRAQQWAERAQSLPLTAAESSLAHFAGGTALLLEGRYETAAKELVSALAGPLPDSLRPLAENNLGVALHHLDRGEDAVARLTAAHEANGSLEATLNLGILLDERQANQAALAYYEAYVRDGGHRSSEVAGWIERLRRVQP